MLIANWSRETSNHFIVHDTIRQDITDLVLFFGSNGESTVLSGKVVGLL